MTMSECKLLAIKHLQIYLQIWNAIKFKFEDWSLEWPGGDFTTKMISLEDDSTCEFIRWSGEGWGAHISVIAEYQNGSHGCQPFSLDQHIFLDWLLLFWRPPYVGVEEVSCLNTFYTLHTDNSYRVPLEHIHISTNIYIWNMLLKSCSLSSSWEFQLNELDCIWIGQALCFTLKTGC